jgi:hypothetical protein
MEQRDQEDHKEVQWVKQMPVAENPRMEKIVDRRVGKKTRRKTYFEYLVKWKGHPIEDASWESEENIQKHGQNGAEAHGQESMNFFPREYDARAS